MKERNIVSLSIIAGAYVTLYACGGDGGGSGGSPSAPPPPPPPPVSQNMDYNITGLEALARTHPETTDPFAVNAQAATISPANDNTSDPLAIDP